MKSITPFIFILVAVVLFFGVTDPLYKQVITLRTQGNEYNDVLVKSTQLLAKRKSLQEKSNSFSPTDVERLRKLIPDGVDNVKLIIDIDEIAKRYGLTIKNVRLDDSKTTKSGVKDPAATITAGEAKYGSIPMGFSVAADYSTFMNFLQDLEGSLRIVDVTNISLKPGTNGVYSFDVSLKTYWLK